MPARLELPPDLPLVIRRDGVVDRVAATSDYDKACWLLRDTAAGKSIEMGARLIRLLVVMQARLSSSLDELVVLNVISGYRPPRTNRTGGGADQSYQMTG